MPYDVMCAWCVAEGAPTVVSTSSVEGSHGVCARHAAGMLAELAEDQRAKAARRGGP